MSILRDIARRAFLAAQTGAAPPYARPGHYGSPLVGASDLRNVRRSTRLPGIDLREAEQLDLAEALVPTWGDVPASATPGWRYHPDNPMFGRPDAALLYSMLGYFRPRRFLEVGSGFSSAIALDCAERLGLETEFTFVEPYPGRLFSLLHEEDRSRCTILEQPVQRVPLETFEELGPGDILFIDSSHVVKAGSDVAYLFLEVLPSLQPGVVVEVHDIFWPFEYPSDWLAERRSWNEGYLLRALLLGNAGIQLLLWASWLWEMHPDIPAKVFPDSPSQRPGSIWLQIRNA